MSQYRKNDKSLGLNCELLQDKEIYFIPLALSIGKLNKNYLNSEKNNYKSLLGKILRLYLEKRELVKKLVFYQNYLFKMVCLIQDNNQKLKILILNQIEAHNTLYLKINFHQKHYLLQLVNYWLYKQHKIINNFLITFMN
ncbi:unnamed protein product [Paramecium sonneborni]|uniref:Uncharacterized protein n=1 Tax=Paramecium sonneborni TaxID=65129 RepID=A0A8S1PKP9_9CILI|nr:unnamed protein product [Paramecium sonneborni]